MLLYFCCLLKGLSLTEAKLPCYFLPSWNWDVLKLLSLYGIIIFDFLSFFMLYTGMHIVITNFLKRIYICHVFKEVLLTPFGIINVNKPMKVNKQMC